MIEKYVNKRNVSKGIKFNTFPKFNRSEKYVC